MFKSKFLIIATTLCCFSITAASAAIEKSSGMYLEGILGYGAVTPIDQGHFKGLNDDGFMGGANVGYKASRHFGIEAGFQKFSKTTHDLNKAGDRTETLNENNYLIDLTTKAMYQFRSGITLFGKLGLASVHTKWIYQNHSDSSKTKIHVYLGAGAAYSITQHLSLVAQVTTTALPAWPKDAEDVPMMSAITGGVNYIF